MSAQLQHSQTASQPMSENCAHVRVYQPYINENDIPFLGKGSIPFDMSFNTANDAREYELFQNIFANKREADPKTFWGLVSAKFDHKAPISFEEFLTQAEKAQNDGADCYLVNPMIGAVSAYINIEEQARYGCHPLMVGAFEHLKKLGYPVDLPQSARHFYYCNYFCGNERFWTGYFEFCERILTEFDKEAEAGTEVGKLYLSSAGYLRNLELTLRPFVIERLLSYYIQHAEKNGLKIAYYRPNKDDYKWKFGPRAGTVLHELFEMKEEFCEKRNRNIGIKWMEKRVHVVRDPHALWSLDDPPRWVSEARED